ncbi:hypothetical protein Sste5346_008182 [Sporothrix stenoceras]|uniref:FAD-binding FR-type domain-containing protein n=1 Tax=Sporothrix stenoceras TaxID=5173 RepID=A0ABR3YQ62_9PEZI
MIPSYTRLTAAATALFLAGAVHVQADTPLGIAYNNQECGLVMFDVYGEFEWPGDYYGDYYGSLCTNPNALVSMYASMYTYCLPEDIEPGLDIMNEWCTEYGEVELLRPSEFAANLTKEAIAALPVYGEGDVEEGSNVTAPFLMSKAVFDVTRRSEHAYDWEQRLHAYYTFACYGFWAIILLFGVVQNITYKIIESRSSYVYTDAEGSGRPINNAKPANIFGRAAAVVRKYVIMPSALPPYHQQRIMGCTIPTRAETFVVASYWIIGIVLGAVNIHGFNGNIFWSGSASQIWRYISDRTGTMSYGNLPLLWIFSGRNNIFLWMTGWSFGTFNIFHRHIARLATLQAIMHSIGYTAYYFCAGYGEYYFLYFAERELWWTLGVSATVVMSFLIIFSFSYFRAKLYENFLIVHIVLSVLLLVFLYYHTAIFDLEDYNYPFILTACVIWGFDRFVRLVRQLYINLHVRRNTVGNGKGGRIQTTKATVTYHEAANILTVDVVPGNAKIFPGPGQHYFLYQPLTIVGWENHPFTLAWWNQTSSSSSTDDDLHLQFWVRPYDGWTKKLVKQCKAKGGSTLTTAPAMLLEGPYGKAEPLHTFDQVLLVAGGSGIAGVLPYLLDYVRRVERGAAAGANGKVPTRTRNITIVWADRSEAFIRFIADGVLAGLLNRPDINVAFHLTGSQPAVADASNIASTASSSTDAVDSPVTPAEDADATVGEKTVQQFDSEKGGVFENTADLNKKSIAAGYRIQAGRPDVLSTVRKLTQSIHGTDARLGVMVCGPNDLADNVRHVVAQNMETTRESIEYFEESFGW